MPARGSRGDGRKPLSSDLIAHAWANKDFESGKCSASMSFDGPKFYSYWTVIAEIVTHNDREAILVSDHNYSPTTSRHLREVRDAIRGRTHFYVPHVDRGEENLGDFHRIFTDWRKQAERILADAEAAHQERKRSRLIVDAYEVVCKMRELAEYFHLSIDRYHIELPAPHALIAGEEVYTRIVGLRLADPSPWMKTAAPSIVDFITAA